MKSQLASLSGETGSSLEKFVGTRVDFFDTNWDMKIERPLSSLKATNGLMSGYDARPHKRKRKGLRFAVVVLLLAVAGVLYSNGVMAIYEYVLVEGDEAEDIIANGKQAAYWRTQIVSTVYHNYVIYTNTTGGKGQVWECLHFNQNTKTPYQFVVKCVSNRNKN